MTLVYEPGVGTHLMDGDQSISVIEVWNSNKHCLDLVVR